MLRDLKIIHLEYLFLLLYCLTFFIYSQWHGIFGSYWMDDDTPQHMLWMYREGKHFFQEGDFMVATTGKLQPWGYLAFNGLLSFFLSPLQISLFMPFFALLATAFFTYFLLRDRFGWAVAILGVCLLTNLPLERMVGFLARAFATPLLMGFLFFWINQRFKAAAATILASALFYPVTFLVIMGITGWTYLLKFITGTLGIKANWRSVVLILGTGLACILVLLLKSYTIQQTPYIGDFLSKEELLSLPEFGAEGRVNFPYHMRIEQLWTWGSYLYFSYLDRILPALGLLWLIHMIWQRKMTDYDISLMGLMISGVVLFFAARWLLPRLFIPERYLQYTYIPAFCLLVCRVLYILKLVWDKYPIFAGLWAVGLSYYGYKLGIHFSYYAVVLAVLLTLFKGPRAYIRKHSVLTLLVVFGLGYYSFERHNPKDAGINDYWFYRAVYDKIKTFDEPLLFAGPLSISSYVPMFCQQSVLVSEEGAHAIYFKGYHERIMPRIRDFVQAYTDIDPGAEELKAFIQKYELDYIIVDKDFFRGGQMYLFQPFKQQLRDLRETRPHQEFIINKLPEDLFLDINNHFSLLDCKALLNSDLNE